MNGLSSEAFSFNRALFYPLSRLSLPRAFIARRLRLGAGHSVGKEAFSTQQSAPKAGLQGLVSPPAGAFVLFCPLPTVTASVALLPRLHGGLTCGRAYGARSVVSDRTS